MATYYIDYVNGNDSTGDGSSATPWKTMDKAHTEASSGDTVKVMDGTYAEGGLTWTKLISFEADTGAAPLIQPASGSSFLTWSPSESSGNLVFDGIDIDLSNLSGTNLDAIALQGSGSSGDDRSLDIKNATITPADASGADQFFLSFQYNRLRLYSVVCDIGASSNTITFMRGDNNGPYRAVLLDNCDISHAADGGGIFALTDPDWSQFFVAQNGCTFKVSGGVSTRLMANNLASGGSPVWFSRTTFIVKNGSSGVDLSLEHGTSKHRFYNCTFDHPNATAVKIQTSTSVDASSAIVAKNCAFKGDTAWDFATSNDEAQAILDYNAYDVATFGEIGGSTYSTLANWKTATSDEANSLSGSLGFTDYANEDYTPTGSSILVNAGLDLGAGYVGSAPDIGAIELTSSSNQTTGIYDFKLSDGTQYPLTVAAGSVFIFDRTPETWESGFTKIGAGFSADANSFWDMQTDSDTVWMLGASEALHKWNGQTETAGTVTVTNGDATVTGSSTSFTNLGADGAIHLETGEVLTISSVTNDTSLELTAAYPGPTQAGLTYTAYTYQPAGGSPPAGKYIRLYKNYLFLAGNSTNTSRLYYSNLKDFETWDAGDFIDINRKDGDPITALFVLGDYLYVGKEDSLWRVYFTGDTTLSPFTLSKVADVGVTSHWSVAGTSTVKFFLSQDGVYVLAVDGLPQKISEPIETSDELFGTEISRWQYANGLFNPDEEEYWLHLTSSGGSTNDTLYGYDLRNQAWWVWTGLTFNRLGEVEETSGAWQAYGGDVQGLLYKVDDGTSDDAVAIDFQVESKAYDGGSPAFEKQLRQLIIYTDKQSAYTLTVSHRTDFNSWVDATVLSTDDQTSGSGMAKVRLFPASDTVGRFHEIKVRNNEADKALVVYGWSLLIQPLGKR